MFRSLQRAMTRALKLARPKLARPAKLIVAAMLAPGLAAKTAKPARRKPAVKAKSAPAPAAKPRARLGETVRRISSGGMPVQTPVTGGDASWRGRGSFKTCQYAGPHGKRSYKLYLPETAAKSVTAMPVLIMLHGCTQTPDDFAKGTAMNRLADEFQIIVAYPAQPVAANRNKCWNWFNPADQKRDGGEPAVLAGIAQQILGKHKADPARVYVAGLSAGGAAAAILATAYPDIFAATGVHSGLPIGAAENAVTALYVMRAGSSGDKQTVPMPTIIFHGDGDTVVVPRNGRSLEARAVATFPALSEVAKNGRKVGGHRFRKTTHRGADRKTYCEFWTIEGAGHAWSGGHPAGSFTDPAGPDASREMVRFFLQHRAIAGSGV